MTLATGPRFLLLRPDPARDRLVVRAGDGAERGQVVGVVLGLPGGAPAFAIVGGAGLLEAHRPVPWTVLEWDEAGEPSLSMPDETWSRVPTLPPEAPVDWNDEAVHRRILSFYDRRPETSAAAGDPEVGSSERGDEITR